MTTEIGIIIALAFILALEILSLVNERKNDTISEVTWRIIFRKPFVPFLAGFLCGHLFWPSERCREELEREAPAEFKPTLVEPHTKLRAGKEATVSDEKDEKVNIDLDKLFGYALVTAEPKAFAEIKGLPEGTIQFGDFSSLVKYAGAIDDGDTLSINYTAELYGEPVTINEKIRKQVVEGITKAFAIPKHILWAAQKSEPVPDPPRRARRLIKLEE